MIEKGETKEEFTRDERKKIWHEGKLQGQFVEKTRNFAHEFLGKRIRNGLLKKETRGHVICSSEAGTKNAKIDKQTVSPKCILCLTKEETVMHLVSVCPKLLQKQYKRRHDNVARRVHWDLCKKYGRKSTDRWYEHTPADIVEKDESRIVLGSYYPDRHDSGTQQAIYYPS